jgi:hypothetical protein
MVKDNSHKLTNDGPGQPTSFDRWIKVLSLVVALLVPLLNNWDKVFKSESTGSESAAGKRSIASEVHPTENLTTLGAFLGSSGAPPGASGNWTAAPNDSKPYIQFSFKGVSQLVSRITMTVGGDGGPQEMRHELRINGELVKTYGSQMQPGFELPAFEFEKPQRVSTFELTTTSRPTPASWNNIAVHGPAVSPKPDFKNPGIGDYRLAASDPRPLWARFIEWWPALLLGAASYLGVYWLARLSYGLLRRQK